MPEFSATTRVSAAHPCLPGHFPGRPLVPAVLLLECAELALRVQLGELRISVLHAAKFLLPVLAEQPIDFLFDAEIDDQVGRGRARFRLQVNGQLAAHGDFGFARD